jgi:major membrane immunogen (membrane-anchored lipoprotein)
MAKKKENKETVELTTRDYARQMLAQEGLTPEDVVTKLLDDAAAVAEKLEAFGMVTQVEPSKDDREKQHILKEAIIGSARKLHTAFHLCAVPNAIRTTVTFPDGEYKIEFKRSLELPKQPLKKVLN